MSDKKKIAPFTLELDTFKKLQKIIAKHSDDTDSIVSIREVFVRMIDKEYEQISGSIRW